MFGSCTTKCISFSCVTKPLKNDKEIAMTAVQQQGMRLLYNDIPEELQDDLDIMATAIKNKRNNFKLLNSVEFRKKVFQAVIEKASSLNTSAVIVASKLGLPWDYGLKILVSQSSNGLRLADEETGFYPFMLLACSSFHGNANLNTVFQSLMVFPDVAVAGRESYGRKRKATICDVVKNNVKKRHIRK